MRLRTMCLHSPASALATILLLLTVAWITPVLAVARWMGDKIEAKNNPPSKNADVPEGLAKSIVRVILNYSKGSGQGAGTVRGSGIVLEVKRDGPQAETGTVCVLTGYHNTDPSTGTKPLTRGGWTFGFGNGMQTAGLRIKPEAVIRPPTPKNSNPPDLTVLGFYAIEWDVPDGIEAAPVDAEIDSASLVIAGFGNTGKVNLDDHSYTEEKEWGTLRIGVNQVKAVEDYTTPPSPRTQKKFSFKAIKSDLSFQLADGQPTSADGYFLGQDSGGPTLQKDDQNNWRLVGLHSSSENPRADGTIPDGREQWDVRVKDHAEWIKKACEKAAKERPKPKEAEQPKARSGEGNVSYDADDGVLSILGHTIADTEFPGDTIIGASVSLPALRNLGLLGDGNQLFVTDSATVLTITRGPDAFLRARLPFLTYRADSNDFIGQLEDVRLANATPSDPFYDPALIAPISHWITAIQNRFRPSASEYDSARRLWYRFNPGENLSALTGAFSHDTTLSGGEDGLFSARKAETEPRGFPEVTCTGTGTTRRLTVCNTGAVADTFACDVMDSRGWLVGGQQSFELFLATGECSSFDVAVEPGGCQTDAADSLYWLCVAKGSSTAWDLCGPIEIDTGPLVVATCAADTVVEPGAMLDLAFRVRNDGPNCADTLRYLLDEPLGWLQNSSGPLEGIAFLEPAQEFVLNLTLQTSPGCSAGESDTLFWLVRRGTVPTRADTCLAIVTCTAPVAVDGDDVIPPSLALGPPIPNPAHASFAAELSLPAASRVYLGLFDVCGRRVATVYDGTLRPGRHTLRWLAAGHERGLASGYYWIVLNTGGKRLSRPLILVR